MITILFSGSNNTTNLLYYKQIKSEDFPTTLHKKIYSILHKDPPLKGWKLEVFLLLSKEMAGTVDIFVETLTQGHPRGVAFKS